MTVGGEVTSVSYHNERAHVTVQERAYWKPGNPLHPPSATAVWVEHAGNVIVPGDKLWWQGRWAMWTPRDKHVVELKLKRIGFSHNGVVDT